MANAQDKNNARANAKIFERTLYALEGEKLRRKIAGDRSQTIATLVEELWLEHQQRAADLSSPKSVDPMRSSLTGEERQVLASVLDLLRSGDSKNKSIVLTAAGAWRKQGDHKQNGEPGTNGAPALSLEPRYAVP